MDRTYAALATILIVTAPLGACGNENSASEVSEAGQKQGAAPAGPLTCPVTQSPTKNGADPEPELFKRIIRCAKGEKTVSIGEEGSVEVEVKSLQIGSSRPWSYRQDSGNGTEDTIVYPVKATYTVRTLYRAATEVEKDWIRILNFYVDSFGEWRIGSEEAIKAGTAERIPKH